jgi:hypothetical protein
MTMRDASHKITICEILRDINDLHQSNEEHDKRVRRLLFTAEKMAKKMSFKLLEYNQEIFVDWWKDNQEYEKKLKQRLKKSYLTGKEKKKK